MLPHAQQLPPARPLASACLRGEQGSMGSLGTDALGGPAQGLSISWEEKPESKLQLRDPGFSLFDFKRKK